MNEAARPRVSAGRRAKAAAEGGAHLTRPRRQVLDALMELGPSDADRIGALIRPRPLAGGAGYDDAVVASVSRILWKLQALGWVEPADGGFVVTTAGVEALSDRGEVE